MKQDGYTCVGSPSFCTLTLPGGKKPSSARPISPDNDPTPSPQLPAGSNLAWTEIKSNINSVIIKLETPKKYEFSSDYEKKNLFKYTFPDHDTVP